MQGDVKESMHEETGGNEEDVHGEREGARERENHERGYESRQIV